VQSLPNHLATVGGKREKRNFQNYKKEDKLKKIIAIVLALVLSLALAAPAMAATTTVYDGDQLGWEAAVGSWATEDFEDDAVGPGISVISTNGVVYSQAANKLWYDSLTYDVVPTAWTTWAFDNPIVAFGGTWDLGSVGGDPECGGPGSNIQIRMMDGSWQDVGVIDNSYIDVFWGFVSDTPFDQVRLQAYNDEGWTERYTLDDMVYTELEVDIDIKPWSDPNSVNRKKHGVIPVGILGSSLLDVTILEGATFEFLGATATAHDLGDHLTFMDHIVLPYEPDPIGNPGYFVTANDDTIPDLVIHFNEDDLTDVGYLAAGRGDTIPASLTITLANGVVIVTEVDTILIRH